MSSCCDVASGPVKEGTLVIALAGNPNSGKTTIFNALTGLRQKVANYPGVTVEKKTGECALPGGRTATVIDLPGTYSLISRSPDEVVATEVLRGLRHDVPLPDVVVVVVDASNLQRNLYLVSQLVELGRPLVVALNMMDIAERRGIAVSAEALAKKLGVPVVPVVGAKRKGIGELKKAVLEAKVAPMPDWPLPDAVREELLVVGGGLAILDSGGAAEGSGFGVQGSELGTVVPPRAWICQGEGAGRKLDRYQAIAERLLIGDRAADLGEMATTEPVRSLLGAAEGRLAQLGIDPMQADIEAHYAWIEGVASAVIGHRDSGGAGVLSYYSPKRTLTERVDRILIHKVWGLLAFAVIMGTLFVSIFWAAAPIMDGLSGGIDWVGAWVASHMSDGPVKDLVTDGIFKGVGAVLVFVPQIAMLFAFLAILEDSGYLARAAFLMDRLLAKVGLNGKSFIPLLSSFACAIPGVMATRTIENRKERLATIMVLPFMSCSARLPVYTLLIGTFFASYGALGQAGIMLALYALGIIVAAGAAYAFKRTLVKGPGTTFILELPTYKVPQASEVGRQVWKNSKEFVTKAGTIIFALSVILWALAYYPRMPESRQNEILTAHQIAPVGQRDTEMAMAVREHMLAAAQSEYSFAGRFGHAVEPVIKPLGYDWKMGVGLVGAFAAREVFVSTMGIIYSVGQVEDDTSSLADVMRKDHYADGRPVWTPVVAASLLVWFVLAMQCMSTVAIVRRETGGWRWPLFMIAYMNVVAYVGALIVYQVGTRLF